MRIIILFILLSVFQNLPCSAQMHYVSAFPYPIEETQPDGSKITIVVKGDESQSVIETLDGYTIIRNNQGIFEYATLDQFNALNTSGIKATNQSARSPKEQTFLTATAKNLRGSSKNKAITKSLPINLKSFPVTGSHKILVLLIKYPDMENIYSADDFSRLFNENNYKGTGSFGDYYRANSFGKLEVTADVFGWYMAAHPFIYYSKNGQDHPVEVVTEAINAAIAQGVDISQYDNDKDGYVEGLLVVHAGPGAEWDNKLNYIWSHMGYGNLSVTSNNTIINRYSIQPETRPWGMVGIGVFCHEFGHLLGLPDLYDTDDSNGKSKGLGIWCLMSSGNWLHNEQIPSTLSAYCKEKLGWAQAPLIANATEYTMAPSATAPQFIRINTSSNTEYYLAENRQLVGFDAALPGSGLAIYHINTSKTGNENSSQKMVDLEEADGRNDLDANTNNGDDGDLFPGTRSNTSFNDLTTPSAKLNNSKSSKIRIGNIRVEGKNILFNYNLTTIGISVTPATSGTTEGAGNYTSGTEITLYAKAAKGYIFQYWLENGLIVSSASTFNFVGTEDRNLVANFAEIAKNPSIIVFPNPTSGLLYIAGVSKSFHASILDLAGDEIRNGMVTDNQMDLNNLLPGIYIIKITDSGKVVSKKFIKE